MGQHDPAKELGKQALEIEEKELGARPERMGDLYSMMAAILAEVITIDGHFLCLGLVFQLDCITRCTLIFDIQKEKPKWQPNLV